MRTRFLAVSEEIANDLSSLSRKIEEVPATEQASQSAAIKAIAKDEERLRTDVSRLAGPLQQRVATMKSILLAQQAIQLELVGLANGRMPPARLRASVNEQLANIDQKLTAGLAESPLPVSPPPSYDSVPREARHTRHVPPTVDRHSANARKAPKKLPIAIPLAALALLLVALSAGLVLFYADLQGTSPEGIGASEQLVTAESVANAPALASEASPTANAPAPQPAPPSAISTTVPTAPNIEAPGVHLPRGGAPLASPTNSGVRTDGMPPGATAKPAPPPTTIGSSGGAERFVPVVFTHKEKRTALLAFAELQRRYPKVLTHRQGELQSVDAGKNGIWHRVVVLPAGSRQEASETCDHLTNAGYDRCWVKAY